MLVLRILRGEEPLYVAFWVSLFIMCCVLAYDYYMPSFSDVYSTHFRVFRILALTFGIICVHNCAPASSLGWRLLARAYVVLLLFAATYTTLMYFGLLWAVAYPILAIVVTYIMKA